MPLLSNNRWVGTEAVFIGTTVQDVFTAYLREKLNGAGYQARLNTLVNVTNSEEASLEFYRLGVPFAEVIHGPRESSRRDGVVDGATYKGSRHKFTLLMDMTMSDHAAAKAAPAGYVDTDRLLVDAVIDILRSGSPDLLARGVELANGEEVTGSTEAQRLAAKRNPFDSVMMAYTLDNYGDGPGPTPTGIVNFAYNATTHHFRALRTDFTDNGVDPTTLPVAVDWDGTRWQQAGSIGADSLYFGTDILDDPLLYLVYEQPSGGTPPYPFTGTGLRFANGNNYLTAT